MSTLINAPERFHLETIKSLSIIFSKPIFFKISDTSTLGDPLYEIISENETFSEKIHGIISRGEVISMPSKKIDDLSLLKIQSILEDRTIHFLFLKLNRVAESSASIAISSEGSMEQHEFPGVISNGIVVVEPTVYTYSKFTNISSFDKYRNVLFSLDQLKKSTFNTDKIHYAKETSAVSKNGEKLFKIIPKSEFDSLRFRDNSSLLGYSVNGKYICL